MTMSRPYCPSNGADGIDFMAAWCDRCEQQPEDQQDGGCQILMRTMIYSVNDPNYPPEWIEDEDGPRCTAYQDREVEVDRPVRHKPAAGQRELF